MDKLVQRSIFVILTSLVLFVGCQGAPQVIDEVADPAEIAVTEMAMAVPPTPPPTNSPMPLPTQTAVPSAIPTVSPTPAPEQIVAEALRRSAPPVRDNVRLAQAYKGLQTVPTPETAAEQIALTLGARESFKILDVVHNTIDDIEAELMGMGEHAYFWFDTGPGAKPPDPAALEVAVETFDAIYAQTIDIFGPEANPGIDGDARLHIVHASPIALCGVTEDSLDNCGTIGLVNSTDLLPVEVDGRSNEREMFVMNQQVFGGDYYLSVLAHEFRHMIEDNYDPADWDWEKEGSATLAAQLSGFPSGGPQRGNQFLQNPDQQLNSCSKKTARRIMARAICSTGIFTTASAHLSIAPLLSVRLRA